jgi:hypothetical protein
VTLTRLGRVRPVRTERREPASLPTPRARDPATHHLSATLATLGEVVARGLASPAAPLPSRLRRGLEQQFERDLSSIRVHHGPDAAESADLLSARAFTVGSHVVLGGETQDLVQRSWTLTHEVAHAVQQGLVEPGEPGSVPLMSPQGPAERSADQALRGRSLMPRTGLAVARDDGATRAASPSVAPSADIEEVLREFRREAMFRTPRARVLARHLLQHMTDRGLWLQHGLYVVDYFLDQGDERHALQALTSVQNAWMVEHVLLEPPHGLPQVPLLSFDDAMQRLIAHAETAARADRHELAFRLFGTAFQLITWQLDAAGPRREQYLRERGAREQVASLTRSLFLYPSLQVAFGRLRRILGFYDRLSAEQRAAGNARAAANYSGLSLLLYRDIREKYVWDSDSPMIAEVQHVPHPGGGGALRIHGVNDVDIDVTRLPGLRPPREVAGEGGFTFQRQRATDVTEALYEQVQLLADLQAEPAIQREFGTTTVDMNDLGHRLRIWRTMYEVYRQRDTLGMGVLHHLMAVIGRYLRAFTIHTEYNIGDFGRSYLANEMRDFPIDLAGRAERDCGVYALTVAYEVFRTARSVSPRLDLEFRLFVLPDHVTLAILDRDQGAYYIVNNDRISPARRGDVMEDVARAYAPIRGRENLTTPAIEAALGTTAMSRATFERQAWLRYRRGTSWGIQVPAPRPGETSTPAERREQAYRAFYAAQRFYDESSPRVHARVDAIVGALARSGGSGPLAVVGPLVPDLTREAVDHGRAFETAGPFALLQTSRPDPALQQWLLAGKRFLYHSGRAGVEPPLVRAAAALLYFEHAGGMLTPLQHGVIALADRVPAMHAALDGYRRAGFPPVF